jgi:restriction endonuclease S subunit
MTAIIPLSPRAFVVWWHELDRWVVPSGAILSRHLPAGWSRPRVGELVKLVSNLVKVEPDHEYKMAGVKWYGEGVFHRETVRGHEQSAKWLTPLVPGALIYNRLFAWKASFAVVPSDLADCFVSNEFPQFVPDTSKILPEYLYLWCVSERTIKAVNAASTGSAAVSRNRFREEFFLDFDIPLPPLPVQRKIVAAHEAARQFAATTAAKIERLERAIEARFLADLGLQAPEQAMLPKAFAVWWSELERWGVELVRRSLQQSTDFKYPTKPLGEVCKTGTGGTPSRKRPEYFGGGIPWVKTTEVRNNVITETEESLSKEGFANCQAKLYPAGSIVIAMYGQGATRGRTAKLGIEATTNQACLVMTDFDPELLPDFAWAYLMVRYHDLRALASGNNQPNLSAELVRAFPIPLPPLPVQQAMMKRVEAGRAEIARLKAEAQARAEAARADVEAMILGTKPVE